MTDLTPEEVQLRMQRSAALMKKVTESAYIPIAPTPKQWLFILDERRELLWGGSAGGGKTIGQLASALLHTDNPHYRAIILRRTFPDLSLPGAPIDIADQWLTSTDAKRKNQGKEWWFPSGAKLIFGYMATDNERYKFQSSRFDFVGFDEASQFTEVQLRYLFSRLRQDLINVKDLPLRYRLTSNPGGVSHEYLKDRYVFPMVPTPERLFIPAGMADNPHLDAENYLNMLAELDPVTRAQLEHGDWRVEPSGNFFLPTIEPVAEHKSNGDWSRAIRCRAWDLAATETGDWAVGVRLAHDRRTKLWRVEDVVRVKAEPAEIERVLAKTAQKDGRQLPQIIEQEGGSAGKFALRDLRMRVFQGHPVFSMPATGNKMTRARYLASLVAAGDVEMAPARWNNDYISELIAFPGGQNDDQVDASSHAANWIAKQVGVRKPRGIAQRTISEGGGKATGLGGARILR